MKVHRYGAYIGETGGRVRELSPEAKSIIFNQMMSEAASDFELYHLALFEMEPGDATRYYFLLSQESNDLLVCHLIEGKSCSIPYHAVHPKNFPDDWNQVTIHLICEVYHRLFGGCPAPIFYDVQKSRPIMEGES